MRRQDALFADDFLRGSDVLSQELSWGEDGREQRRRSVRETMVQEVGGRAGGRRGRGGPDLLLHREEGELAGDERLGLAAEGVDRDFGEPGRVRDAEPDRRS